MLSLSNRMDLDRDGDGEIPVPYNLAAEESVLGSLLLDRDAIIQAASFLKARHFYRETNAWIYQAVCDLYERREPPDLVTLSAELERRRVPRGAGSVTLLDAVGGLAYLAGLQHGVPTAVHIEYYARIVYRCARRRRAITIGGKIAGLGYEMGLSDEEWEAAVWQVYRDLDADEPTHGVRFADAASAYLDRLAKQQKGGLPPGISTGLDPLDAAGVYFEDGTLNLLVGRTSGGKTAGALQFVRNIVTAGKHVVVLSLEMDTDSLVRRLLSGQAGVEMRVLREASLGDRHWEDVYQAAGDLSGAAGHLTLIDEGITTIDALQVEVQRIQAAPDGGCDLLVVDYLQLVQAEGRRGQNREQEVSSVSRALKRLGRQCRCAVLALSQTNNAAEDRSTPSLRDIRESGGPTHDASVVMYLLSPDKAQPHWVDCHVLKNRDGERDTLVPLHWEGRIQQFTPMSEDEYAACVRAQAGDR